MTDGEDFKQRIKELAKKSGIGEIDIINVANYVICEIIGMPAGTSVEVGDWTITSVDGKCFYISEKYTDADMSRFLHDDFTKKNLLKENDRV